MDNALGEPQTILLLGGTSDIGLAIVRELLKGKPSAAVLGSAVDVAAEKKRVAVLQLLLPSGPAPLGGQRSWLPASC